jgi:superfamily II RNA helicase
MAKREEIKIYCKACSEKLKDEKNATQNQYKGKNNFSAGP